jgi:molybdopterin-dependent oxidoreductase alpha subunit
MIDESSPEEISAETPEAFTGLTLGEPKSAAAGLPAVIKAMQHVYSQAGVIRGTKALMQLNQHDGIDCMSCAWPDPDEHRAMAEFCENGAKAIAWEADTRKADREFFAKHTVAELSKESDYWHGQQGRLVEPMILREGKSHYESITWNDAFATIADALNSLASPDEAIFYTSGRASNEAAFLYQLFIRQFGTNNLPDCSNMCHESSGSALNSTIGIGKGTVTLDDFQKADVIFILGQNPGTNHPRMLTSLQAAKRRGCKIISANPLKETGLLKFKHPQEISGVLGSGTTLTDLYLQVKINGDAALLQGIMKVFLEQERLTPGKVLDAQFIADRTIGFDALRSAIETVEWPTILEQTGLSREEIVLAAEMLMKSNRFITCWAMGLTQHHNGVAAIQEIVNLHLMRGAIGKPGAGLCPVRGHSNVQGDRTMGIWEKPKPEFLDKLKTVFDFEPPRHDGYDTVEAIHAMHEGKGKVFIALGGNFLSATPDTEFTAEALQKCELTVQVSTKLNRSHLITGKQAIILPCLGRSEIDMQKQGPQFVTCENSMGVVQSSHGKLSPASTELLSEPAIVANLASAALKDRTKVDWLGLVENYDRIRDLIEKVIPGFDRYNERVRTRGGFYLPNAPRDGQFKTVDAKAHFSVNPLPENKLQPDELVMMTIRTHDQFNTTIYGLDDRYRGIYNERRVVLINEADMKDRDLKSGQVVDLIGHHQGKRRIAKHFIVVPYDIPCGSVATYFPETNVLVPIDSTARISNTPTSKYVVIRIEPTEELVPLA